VTREEFDQIVKDVCPHCRIGVETRQREDLVDHELGGRHLLFRRQCRRQAAVAQRRLRMGDERAHADHLQHVEEDGGAQADAALKSAGIARKQRVPGGVIGGD